MTHRNDIDGLRAVAVLAVMFFHAGLARFQGGYVGVDVFFVISGFLITGILAREQAAGTFSFARFYERRARRILPALTVVLAVTTLVAYLVMFPSDLQVYARGVVAVSLFAANLLFWRGHDYDQAGNYFARLLDQDPLMHTWSLGIEEQFYLIFPVCAVLGWRLWGKRSGRLLLLTGIASLAIAEWASRDHPKAAFYLLPTRAWELLLGGAIVFDTTRARITPAIREGLAIAGLGLVLASIAVYDGTMRFPGVYALAPTIGAALLLAYADGTRVAALLSWRPLVGVGLISYSAYLWHQPVLAFARYASLNDPSSTMTLGWAAGLSLITLALAYVTWKFIETPFRDRQRVPLRALVSAYGAATIGLLAVGVAFGGDALRAGLLPDLPGLRNPQHLSCPYYTEAGSTQQAGCLTSPSLTAVPAFMVIGDSHASALLPAFEELSRRSATQGRLFSEGDCPPLFGLAGGEYPERCAAMKRATLELVTQQNVRRVFLVARWRGYVNDPAFGQALGRTIDSYASLGARTIIVEQPPEQLRRPRRIYWRALLWGDATRTIRDLSVTTEQFGAQRAAAAAIFAPYRDDARVQFIDLSPVLCDGSLCPVGTPRESYWVDTNHLSREGAGFVSETLARLSLDHPPPRVQ